MADKITLQNDEQFLPTNLDIGPSPGAVVEGNLAGENEETERLIAQVGKTVFDRYKSDRESYETIWETLDYMYKCAQNRSINATEEPKGADLPDAAQQRANTGSTSFYRNVNQFAAQYMAVHLSRDLPFKYSPIINENIFSSSQEAADQAENHDILARWTLKRNKDGEATPNFATMVYKYGSYPEMVSMRRRFAQRTIRQPVYTQVPSESRPGEFDNVITDTEEIESEFLVESFPAFNLFSIWSLYADQNIGDIQKQNWVFLVDVVSLSGMIDEVAAGNYSADQLKKLTKQHFWDGDIGGEHRETEQASEGLDQTVTPSDTNQFLRWNIFGRIPVGDDGKWDVNTNPPALWWITAVGNSLDNAIILRMERNLDPDDEIPIHLTRAMPGEPDSLYHMAPGQAIRSNYSVECTLKGQVVDESTSNLQAPLIITEGAFPYQEDFVFDGSVWITTAGDPNAAWARPTMGNASAQAMALLEFINDDTQRALAFDKPFTGQSFGARTSATEADNIFRTSSQPHLAIIRYIMSQRETWRAKKIKSYIQAFAPPEQIIAITDDANSIKPVVVGELHGEFDIEINIVDEFQNDTLRQQSLNDAIALIGQVPQFLERIDIDELLREFLNSKKLPGAKLIIPAQDFDASERARSENNTLLSGTFLPPTDGQNHKLHLVEHKAERLRWAGVEGLEGAAAAAPQVANLPLLDQHIALTEDLLTRTAGGALNSTANPGGGPERGTRNETPGEAAGNPAAGALGRILGG